jgi:predicted MFS family arabinose efflux permease
MLGAMLSWGASAMLISYMRTYLEGVTRGDAGAVTLLFTVLGLAGFIGTWAGGQLAARHGQRALALPAGLMALVALGLVAAQTSLWAVAGFLVVFGAANTAMSIIWMMWLARNIDDAPELAGSLILPALQLAIMAGGMLGGALLDWGGVAATYLACAGVAVLAVVLVRTGKRMEKG